MANITSIHAVSTPTAGSYCCTQGGSVISVDRRLHAFLGRADGRRSETSEPSTVHALLNPVDIERLMAQLAEGVDGQPWHHEIMVNGQQCLIRQTCWLADAVSEEAPIVHAWVELVEADRTATAPALLTHLVAGQLSDVITWVSRDGEVLYVTPSVESLTGFTQAELLGAKAIDLVHPADHERLKAAVESVRSDQCFALECRRLRKDGSYVWIEARCQGIKDDNGTLQGDYICVSRDITERKVAEQQLRQRDDLLQQITEHVRDVIWMTTAEGDRVLYVSEAFEAIWGVSVAAVYSKSNVWEDSIHPADRGEALNVMERQLRGECTDWKYRIVRPDGEIRRIRDRAYPIRDKDGKIYRVTGIAEDVTEHDHFEQELDASRAALQKSEERYALAQRAAGIVSWDWDVNSDSIAWSENVHDILGFPDGVAAGNFREYLSLIPEDERQTVAVLLRMVVNDGEELQVDHQILMAGGRRGWVSIMGRVIRDAGGRAARVVGVLQDITARKESEEEIRRYGARLESMVEERTARIQELERQRMQSEQLAATARMAAYIAHEINNPLAGITNAFQLVKMAVPEGHPYESFGRQIENELARIADIVRQMFALYRSDYLEPRPFRVDEVIGSVISLLDRLMRDRRVEVLFSKTGDFQDVYLPESFFRQIIFNLLSNGIEASREGQEVTISAHLAGQTLTITVEDAGTGIAPFARDRVFEPFFSTKKGMQGGGMGLGLSITRSLVETMEGTISFAERAGGGTVFSVVLPQQTQQGVRKYG